MYHPQIETFVIVAESGSFSKAAEAMYMTPTAVMKQINALEKRLGITLILRTNRGLSITEAGKSFFEDAKYMMAYSARAVEKAKNIEKREHDPTIRIGTSVMTPAKFLLDIWTRLQACATDLKIELIPFENTPENAREILRNLGRHIDVVAGIYDDRFLADRHCRVAHLENKKIHLAVPLTHPLAQKQAISFRDLKKQSVMLIQKGWNVYIDEMRRDLIAQDTEVKDFDFFSINAFNQAVKDNIPILAVDGWEDVHPLLKIIPVEWEYTVPFGIMYATEPSGQVKRFIGTVAKAVHN